MMLSELKKAVCNANQDLIRFHLVTLTWGNVSGIARRRGLVVIKPSGMAYDEMKPSDMVVVDWQGKVVEGTLRPSSDTAIHLELYRAFPHIGGICHTHSEFATVFAQACREIPCLGTTHADCFNGPVPVTRMIRRQEVEENYEKHTGRLIVERFAGLDHLEMPAVLVAGHGAFTWGGTPQDAVRNSLALEKVARMAWETLRLKPSGRGLPDYLLRKHFRRKHGPKAYYGQKKKGEKK